MTRLEENQMLITEMVKRAKDKPTGTYEEMMTFQTGAIASMLGDISKSLAILADKVEKEQALNNLEEAYLSLMRTQAKYEDKLKVLDKIEEEVRKWYWNADIRVISEDPCVVDAMIDLFIRTIKKYQVESEIEE